MNKNKINIEKSDQIIENSEENVQEVTDKYFKVSKSI